MKHRAFEVFHCFEMNLQAVVSRIFSMRLFIFHDTHVSRERDSSNGTDECCGPSSECDTGLEVLQLHFPLRGCRVPDSAHTLYRCVDMRSQVKFVDGVFNVLQDFSLFSKFFGPIRIEIEGERVQLGMYVTSTLISSVWMTTLEPVANSGLRVGLTILGRCSTSMFLQRHLTFRIS